MRIISQDGTLDVPYKKVAIQRYKGSIYFLSRDLTGVEGVTEDMLLAEYSIEAKAQKAMKMLLAIYEEGEYRYFQFP